MLGIPTHVIDPLADFQKRVEMFESSELMYKVRSDDNSLLPRRWKCHFETDPLEAVHS